ncbi:hypothetical protein [Mycobacteroides abscessus]|uniref:hypothetical protein n=1 Tax=Mycobacteroides abscessus TaxID=36809 RepID=UPI001F1947CC|nr:hypothetical protein [Mycobacteroides abscessus]
MADYLSFNVDEVIGLYEVDAMIAAANSIPEGAPVGTIARRPDGGYIAIMNELGWEYFYLDVRKPRLDTDGDYADSWPQIRPDQWPDQSGLDWFPPGEEPLVPRPDPTAQQEPPKGLYGKYRVERVDGKPIRACFVLEYLDDLHANKALLEYAFSVERVNPELAKDLRAEWGKWPGRSQQEPATTHPVSPESTNCVPKPRTPRVVDRLGVDEQGSRWRNREGLEFRHDGTRWVSNGPYGDMYGADYEPHALPPYTEIVEPRVLPSLDCEEARDGTVWGPVDDRVGRRYKFVSDSWKSKVGDEEWYTLRSMGLLEVRFGPFTEVIE